MNLNERIGAWLTPGGCFFRVWAPHAESVSVLFQPGPYWEVDDTVTEHALARDGDYWSATVPGVQARAALPLPDRDARRRGPPAARSGGPRRAQLRADAGRPGQPQRSIVSETARFRWAPFETPRFENFIIYQFHVGSFAGRGDELDKPWATFAGRREQARLHPRDGLQLRPAASRPGVRDGPLVGLQPGLVLRARVVVRLARRAASTSSTPRTAAGSRSSSTWSTTTSAPATTCSGSTTATANDGGIYFEGGQMTQWGRGPAWWKQEVQDFFYQNARMYFEEYRADGLRFDVTTQINGQHLSRRRPPARRVPRQVPRSPSTCRTTRGSSTTGRFCATWHADARTTRCQRALAGQDPLREGEAASSAGTATTTPGTW